MRDLIQGRTLDCIATGKSYKRTVATCSLDGADLSCLAIKDGIATRWAKYDRGGQLLRCEQRVTLHDLIVRKWGHP
jgi:endonuclease YncB( thermonuclease family)